MAKLTESYLRGMIKQVMNEMYDDSHEALEASADLWDMGGEGSEEAIREAAAYYKVDPAKLKAFLEAEFARNEAEEKGMSKDPNDYLAERKRVAARTAPKRK